MNRGFFAALIGAITIAVAVSGCGGSSEGATSGSTKAEFVRKGNAICKKAEEDQIASFADATAKIDPTTKLSLAEREALLFPATVPPLRRMTEELGDLSAPEGEEEAVEAIVTAYEDGLERSEANHAAGISGDAFVAASKLANEYGLSCGI